MHDLDFGHVILQLSVHSLTCKTGTIGPGPAHLPVPLLLKNFCDLCSLRLPDSGRMDK